MVTTPLMFLHALSLLSINALGRKVDQGYSESALSVRRDVNQSIPPHFEINYCIENNSRKRLIVQVMGPTYTKIVYYKFKTYVRYNDIRSLETMTREILEKKLFIANSML